MKRGDYQTLAKAITYAQKRFGGGLKSVDRDEKRLLDKWLTNVCLSGFSFLDLGAGTGRMTTILLGHKPKVVYALDLSPKMLTVLTKSYPNETKAQIIKTIICSSEKIPLADNSIDLVIAFHFFKHIKKIETTFKEVFRVLKPQGIFIFDHLNSKSLIRFSLGSCYLVSEREIVRKLEIFGFSILKSIHLHPLGESVYRINIKLYQEVLSGLGGLISQNGKRLGTKIFVLAQKK